MGATIILAILGTFALVAVVVLTAIGWYFDFRLFRAVFGRVGTELKKPGRPSASLDQKAKDIPPRSS